MKKDNVGNWREEFEVARRVSFNSVSESEEWDEDDYDDDDSLDTVSDHEVIESQFARGDEVVALWQDGDKWYRARVMYVHPNGQCDLKYKDGDRELRVDAFLIQHYVKARRHNIRERKKRHQQRRPNKFKNDAEFSKGDRIEAKFDGEWIAGIIRRVNDNCTYDINFRDGTVERGLDERLVRYPKRYDRDFSNDESASSASERESDVLYEKNEKIEARFRGKARFCLDARMARIARFVLYSKILAKAR